MSFLLDVGLAFMFASPIFVSNAIPTIFGGGYPVDFYKNFIDGKRILGNHKTIRGLLAGILFGFVASIVVWYTVGDLFQQLYGLMGFKYPIWIGLVMGWGCNFGDMFGSFIKRRLNIVSGGKFPVFDQTGYMIFGLLWSWPVFKFIPWQFLVTLLVISPLLHILANLLAYAVKAKDVWW
ncbi:MAG: CDP-2,3-bis-(O-geranylgeranyl)-sn-glycerol synthase [Candidatus Heimdallarchaeum endolithica]|uniref:CDP-2,3-bis-(O-geranylgeranyl)-sn-glycerol synthase n=1 Tax=Candidatus Heimdallarchaeum endolithica TaxID=2876572 RepID=A0A9Y1FNG1_9ARCH|nr:MAG: CDP-2,3-bis-(O-geranylgeranyl)-sn-glycerol synthase [Candidatus Heimdallarchaeum endolithica]